MNVPLPFAQAYAPLPEMATRPSTTLHVARAVPDRRKFAEYIVGELGDTSTTALTYELSLQRMERYLGKPAHLFVADDVRGFMRSHYAPATKNTAMVSLRAFLRFGLLEGWVDPHEALRVLSMKAPKQRRHRKPPLSIDEVHVVLGICRTSNEHRLVYGALFQGLRVSDCARLSAAAFCRDRLRFTSVKGDKPLELPLHRELERVRDLVLQRSPTRDTLKSTCKALAFRSGIVFSSHTLRATFARRLDDLGVQEGVAIELMGHEQVTVYRRHYAYVSWEAMTEAIALLRY